MEYAGIDDECTVFLFKCIDKMDDINRFGESYSPDGIGGPSWNQNHLSICTGVGFDGGEHGSCTHHLLHKRAV